MRSRQEGVLRGWLALAAVASLASAVAPAEAGERWRVDVAGHVRHFQQQVKSEVGAVRGERLVFETEVGLGLAGSYDVTDWLAAGAFVRADVGTRRAGRFAGIDDEGRTVIDPAVGGPYRELWLGPQLRGQWRMLFAELGYGLCATTMPAAIWPAPTAPPRAPSPPSRASAGCSPPALP